MAFASCIPALQQRSSRRADEAKEKTRAKHLVAAMRGQTTDGEEDPGTHTALLALVHKYLGFIIASSCWTQYALSWQDKNHTFNLSLMKELVFTVISILLLFLTLKRSQ